MWQRKESFQIDKLEREGPRTLEQSRAAAPWKGMWEEREREEVVVVVEV